MIARDLTYLDPVEPAPDACERCTDAHISDESDPEYPERCGCRCHWTADDYEIEALNLAGYDV